MRWVVGDIHGCAREFALLLKTIRFDPSRDELWSVGDLINTGPDSPAALRLWRDAGATGVLGNHDIYALRVRSGRRDRKADTLDTLFDAPDADELLACLRGLPLLQRLAAPDGGRDAWLVHAGLHPAWTGRLARAAREVNTAPHDEDWLEREATSFATNVRCCDARGQRVRFTGFPDDCPDGFLPWDTFYRGDDLIVHGHWARRGHYRTEKTLGLDSGCVYGGALTAWCQDEDRIVQIPSIRRG